MMIQSYNIKNSEKVYAANSDLEKKADNIDEGLKGSLLLLAANSFFFVGNLYALSLKLNDNPFTEKEKLVYNVFALTGIGLGVPGIYYAVKDHIKRTKK